MISVTVEIRENEASRRVRITAPSIERALGIAGHAPHDGVVRVVFPLDPNTFFVQSKISQPFPDCPEAA